MAEHEFWRGERAERYRIMEQMEEDRAARERYALRDEGGEDEYRRRQAEQRGAAPPGAGPDASHRGRGPRGYRRTDARILEDVSDRLADDPHLDAGGIEVAVAQGEVTLSGTVDGRAARRHAEDLAASVPGVRQVMNGLRTA
jgi:osmotically-inducible protein OsmY